MSVIRYAPMRVTTFRFHAAGGWVRHEDYAELEQQLAELQELLTLIRDDLRMRSEDGVVDISDFIWMRIDKVLQEKGE